MLAVWNWQLRLATRMPFVPRGVPPLLSLRSCPETTLPETKRTEPLLLSL